MHTALFTGALGRRRRPGARLVALLAVGVALALQVVPPFGSAHAASSLGSVQTAALVPGVDLQVSMSGPAEAVPHTAFVDSILVTNGGTDPATGVTFVLTAPPTGVTYSITDPGVTCDPSWHCTLADLPSGSQRVVSLGIQTAAPLTDGSSVHPIVQVATTATDVDPSNDTAAWATALSEAGELAVTVQRTTAAQVLPGQRAIFKITLTNNGPNVAQAPQVYAHPLAAPASSNQVASASGAACRAVGTQGVWSCLWPTIPVGQSRVMNFAANASPHLLSGSFPALAEAISENSDGAVAWAAATVTDNDKRPTDVSVTTYSTPKIKPDKLGSFKVTVTNHGPWRAHDVVLVETVPKGFYWKKASGRVILARHTRTRSISLQDLEVGESRTFYGKFRYPVGATLTWTSKVSHSDPDSKGVNNTDTSSTRILGPIVKAVSTVPKGSDTVVKTTSTSSSTSSTDTNNQDVIYNDAGQVVSGSTSSTDKQKLADTGGPALRIPLLGFTLVLLGIATTANSRQRRPVPRHRAWVSPYA